MIQELMHDSPFLSMVFLKVLVVDCFQIKNFANERLVEKLGFIEDALLQDIHQTVAKTFDSSYKLQI